MPKHDSNTGLRHIFAPRCQMAHTPSLFATLVALLFIVSNATAEDGSHGLTATQSLLRKYCTTCHSGDSPEAELSLDFNASEFDPNRQYDLWQTVLDMVQAGEMPPEDEPQLEPSEREQLIQWLVTTIDRVDCGQLSQPGRVTIHRLNRTEYKNTIRDLLGIATTLADEFPADDVGNGFDNMAEVLSLPPLLMESYLNAAEQIVDQLFADEEALRGLVLDSRPDDERERAEEALTRLAGRAFRQPISDDERDGLTRLYQERREDGVEFPRSLDLPVTAILTSPRFLFRVEQPAVDAPQTEPQPLSSFEVASRLSYFLWSSMPDDELFAAAANDQLTDRRALADQAIRMLNDDKSEALIDNFVGQWLQLRKLSTVAPDPKEFPSFDESLRSAMRTETETFADSIFRQDRSVLDFLDSDYTYLNGRLAEHYGIAGVEGAAFRRVSLPDGRRGGVLTHGSILTLTSNPTRTSPVKRGKWILDNILGTPPPPPPPGVEELAEGEESELLGSLREQMEQHREDPSCAVCHRKMDALGFGFENFDAIGAWRDADGRFPIDAAGSLPGDQTFQSPDELREILRNQRQDEFLRCLASKMLAYALGRELEPFDRCAVDEIILEMRENDYRFSSLIVAVVQSDPFRKRGSVEGE